MPSSFYCFFGRCSAVGAIVLAAVFVNAQEAPPKSGAGEVVSTDLFRRDNLVAWCIVPFDSKKRGPEERAGMLKRLGFSHFAYDYRAEHVPTFDAEVEALKRHGVGLDAWWFPGSLNEDAKKILAVIEKHGIHPQLWVSGGGTATKTPEEQEQRVQQEVARLRPIVDAAAKLGCRVGLYNHGGWYGEPENQLAMIEQLKAPHVGIVYNQHHGHDHVDRFSTLLKKMLPHLLALNLNGMIPNGDKVGKKIVPLGQGELDLSLLKTIASSGYRGPIGILGHTSDDAEQRLQDNLDGLDWLVLQLLGKPAGPKPSPRTYRATVGTSSGALPPSVKGFLAEGRAEYRTAPLTIECRATLEGKAGYNILLASDTKQSGQHWEIFSMPGTGKVTAYLPGMQPDHARGTIDIADGKSHHIVMLYEAHRVRLYVDNKLAADQAVTSKKSAGLAGGLGFGRLVEGNLGCNGNIEFVRILRGIREEGRTVEGDNPRASVSHEVLGEWRFDKGDNTQVSDVSPLKNHAKQVAMSPPTPAKNAIPPDGVHLSATNPNWKVELIERSPNEVFMAVKSDTMGRLFVGGREGVFVFEPDDRGGYLSKKELLRFPNDSIIIGLEWRGVDLYVLTSSALYLIPEGRVKREGLKPQRILWGLPLDLHVSFHCLAWGPDGDLFVNHGDPLLNFGDWKTPDHWGHWTLYAGREERPIPYTGAGAVLRMKPDGSDVRVVAGGLRGPVGLTFDKHGNLFTNDNDHESRADQYAPAKLMHVTPHNDFGWPRGWMASKSPDRSDLLEPMSAGLGRGVPCDLLYYDEPYFAECREQLLMCRWDRHAVTSYKLQPRGATFAVEEETIVTGKNNARPVGVAVDVGGRLFVTAVYMAGNMASPYCASDLLIVKKSEQAAVKAWEPYEITQCTEKQLLEHLASASWERRYRAEQELLRRGVPFPVRASLFSTNTSAELDLEKVGPREQLATLIRYIDGETPQSWDAILRLAASEDSYLRQTALIVLARRAERKDLASWCEGVDSAIRRAAIAAVGRRLVVPLPNDQPPTEVSLSFPKESSFFKTKLTFWGEAQPVDLAKKGRIGSYTAAQRWGAVKHSDEQEALFALLARALDDADSRVQLEAAYYLGLLRDPRTEPKLDGTKRAVVIGRLLKAGEQRVTQAWGVGPFAGGDGSKSPAESPEVGVIDLTAKYRSSLGEVGWKKLEAGATGFTLGKGKGKKSPELQYLLFRLQSGVRQPALVNVESNGGVLCWQNGTFVKGEASPNHAAKDGAGTRFLMDLQPGSNDFLVRVTGTGEVTAAIRIQSASSAVATLPEPLDSALLAERLRAAATSDVTAIPKDFLEVNWVEEGARGNASQGQRLFGTLGCAKCHAITPEQKGAGAPSLTEARRRFTTPHLVESILLPSKQVAEPFRATHLVTDAGQVLSGLVTAETAESLELLMPDASRKTVRKAAIEERRTMPQSPMPHGLVKTPDELRDLLAYLLSERPLPP